MKLGELIKIRDQILLNPAWQRGPVWPEGKKALLIDSILRNYGLPMLYMMERKSSVPYKYEVVDGQQRLLSVWDFIDDRYPLGSDRESIEDPQALGKRFSELSNKFKDRIETFQVIVAIIKDAREPEISRLFSRMQMGVRLNPPELRNAVQSGLRHAVDTTARTHPFFVTSRIPRSRFKHQDYLAHAISICVHGATRDLKAPQLMSDYNEITDPTKYAPLLADAGPILDFLKKINERLGKRITQKWAFVDLFYLLYQRKNRLNKIDVNEFARIYDKFDKERLRNTAEPQNLLKERARQTDRDLYTYILAFKISGGERKNAEQRNAIMGRRFKGILGA